MVRIGVHPLLWLIAVQATFLRFTYRGGSASNLLIYSDASCNLIIGSEPKASHRVTMPRQGLLRGEL